MVASDKEGNYVLEVMPSVTGWFHLPDAFLFRLINHIQKTNAISGHLLEIGVFQGKSFGLLSTFRREGEIVFGFDLFAGQASLEESLQTVERATGSTEGVKLVTANSLTIPDSEVRTIVDGPVRFLHIDGGHDYGEALSDMRKFVPLVREGGVVAIDDYYDKDFPGVPVATADFTRESELVPFVSGHLKLYLCHPKYSVAYISALLEHEEIRDTAFLTKYRDQPLLMPFAERSEALKGPLLDFIKKIKRS